MRVYIDGADGINVDDCAKVSRQVSSVLDVEDPIAGEYTLEVSSPGMDRPLFQLEQYSRYVASRLRLNLRHALRGEEILRVVDWDRR